MVKTGKKHIFALYGKIKNLARKYLNKNQKLKFNKAAFYGIMFSQAIQDCPWLKYKGFTLGDFNWAMDALSLHNLYRILEDVKPKNIIEFGLGQSSKMIHQYAGYYNANALTVEHDRDWINYIKTSASQIKFNIRQCDLEGIEVNGRKTVSSKNISQIYKDWNPICGGSLVILDGICDSAMKNCFNTNERPYYGRPQVFEYEPNLKDGFCIFMHDSENSNIQNTLNLFCDRLNQKGAAFLRREYYSTKNHTVICSKNWGFLTSI